MMVESGPVATHSLQEMLMLSDLDIGAIRQANPDVVIRDVNEDDLKKWALSPQIFHDVVPWRGVQVTAWEIEAGLQGFLNSLDHTGRIGKKWGLR